MRGIAATKSAMAGTMPGQTMLLHQNGKAAGEAGYYMYYESKKVIGLNMGLIVNWSWDNVEPGF